MPAIKVTLAKKYESTPKMRKKVDGWLLFTKYDGSRGYYSHKDKTFYSRGGKIITMPKKIIDEMPDNDLDGEFFLGPGTFHELSGFMRTLDKSTKKWPENLRFIVFDRPDIKNSYFVRMPPNIVFKSKFLIQAPYTIITPATNLEQILAEAEETGEEGLIMRNPNALYENKRTGNLLKYTSRFTDEAVVIGYEFGEGRLSDMMGALKVESMGENKVQFKVGTGFTYAQRKHASDIFSDGTVITFACKSFEDGGKPREPSFIGIRDYE
jgi:DNA ligase-1